MRALTTLLVVTVGIALAFRQAAALQQIPIPRYGIAITPPAGWVSAQDSLVDQMDAALARRTGFAATELVALLVPDTATSWLDLPYVMVRVDTIDTYETKREATIAMGEMGAVIAESGGRISKALQEKDLISSLQFGTAYYDSTLARLWIGARGTSASGQEMQGVVGSQVYRGGRIGISYYAPVTTDVAVATAFVSRMLDELHIPAGMGLPERKSPATSMMQQPKSRRRGLFPSTLLGNVALDWVGAGVLAALFYGASRGLGEATVGRKLLEWAAILVLATVLALHILGRIL